MKIIGTGWSTLMLMACSCFGLTAFGGGASAGEAGSAFRHGDLVLDDDMMLPRTAWLKRAYYTPSLWPDGVIPYQFDSNVSAQNRTRMRAAMDEWEAAANLVFVPRTDEADYVLIKNATSNSSAVGFLGGEQPVNIKNWSVHGTLLHELGHTLGLFHEHQRSDRGAFIIINWQNIIGSTAAFQIRAGTAAGPYDFRSIMHYSQYASAAPPNTSITARPGYEQYQHVMGTFQELSALDKSGMHYLYPDPDDLRLTPDVSNVNVDIGDNPAPQTVYARSHGNGEFAYQLASDDPWIAAIVPPGGIAPPQGEFANQHQVVFQTDHLPRGVYSGLILGTHLEGGLGDVVLVNLTVTDHFAAISHLWHQPDLCDPQSGGSNDIGRMVAYQNDGYACL